jgi:pyrroloquinoline-quinone synthase
MNLPYQLLDHPFYQAWSAGAITRVQLARYARSYAGFIAQMPVYWARIGADFQVDTSKIVAEEAAHAALWDVWSAQLIEPAACPPMTEVLDAFAAFTPSALLGAVQSFEVQQPAVARTKKDGLLAHYGFTETDLAYFDAHLYEQEHIDFGRRLAAAKATPAQYDHGFNHGAKVVYRSLDLFGP